MRTPTWESSTGALAAFLGEGVPILKVDAWTVTLGGGTVLRWSGADRSLTFGGNTFSLGPGLVRGQVKWKVGIGTDSLDLRLTDIAGTTVSGVPLQAFIAARGMDNAEVRLERLFCRIDGTPVGALLWFLGFVDDVEGDRHEAQITLASFTRMLDVQVPQSVYQSPCSNQVFDPFCKASRAAFTVAGSASSGTDSYRGKFSISGLGEPDGWGDLGIVTMTSGPNAGVRRTCKRHTTTYIQVLQPWPFDVTAGDAFSLEAGCDRAEATCKNKFSNGANFRIGTPNIPVAETVL